ncbi:TPA: recombinase family protein [Vibrio vulnificus]
MKAYLYSRFSTKQQESGDSLRRQLETAKAWCTANEIELSDLTFEDLGVSAFKEGGKRPALADLVNAIETGKIATGSYILVENDDRLSRLGWYPTQQMIRHMVLGLNVKLVVLSSNTIYTDENIEDIAQNVLLMFNADRAHKESLRKSEMIRASRKQRREQESLTGKLPFWLDRIEDTIVLNERAKVVTKIFELKQSGFSNQKIARDLNNDGIPSATGVQWNASAIRAVYTNHAVYGAKAYYVTDSKRKLVLDKVAEQKFPSIVSKSDFQAVQHTQSVGRRSTVSPFTGLFRCGCCSGGMVQRTSTYKDKKMIYRKCIGATEGRCEQTTQIRQPDDVLKYVLSKMQYVVQKHEPPTVEHTKLQAQFNALKATEQTLLEKQQFGALEKLYVTMNDIEQKLLEANKNIEISRDIDFGTDFRNVFDLESAEEQNAVMKKLLDRIEIHYLGRGERKTTILWRVKVVQRNNHVISFMLRQAHGFGNWTVKFKTDTEQLQNEILALTKDVEDFEYEE